MNQEKIPFNAEQMLLDLRPWVLAESPCRNASACNKAIDLAVFDLVVLGAEIIRVPGKKGYGDALIATINSGGASTGVKEPGVLLCCHVDTNHATGSLHAMPYRKEGNKLWGPGILSAKSNIFLVLDVLKKLKAANWNNSRTLSLLVVSDKNMGYPVSSELVESVSAKHSDVLVFEPASNANSLYLGRSALSRYNIDVKVDNAQSGDTFRQRGTLNAPSAIRELSRNIIDIEDMSADDYTFKVGAVHTGLWSQHAEKCTAHVLCEAHTQEAVSEGSRRIHALNSANPDLGLHVNQSVTLPLWQANDQSTALFERAAAVAKPLGMELVAEIGGGGSMANITGALEVATIDGLGCTGAGIYSREEHINVDSLVQRGKLLAALLQDLCVVRSEVMYD